MNASSVYIRSCFCLSYGKLLISITGHESAFTGVQIDNETPEPEEVPQCIINDYDKIKIDTLGFSTKWTDKTKAPQESYPIPIREYDGQR